MQEIDKMTIAAVVQRNGGRISAKELVEEIIKDGYSREEATVAVDGFKNCRLVAFDGTTFSFVLVFHLFTSYIMKAHRPQDDVLST